MFILLLGSPSILLDQRPVEALRRKNRALVYYLAANPRPVTRDQALALFWPDTPRPAAQQTLRSMLHDLRRQLGPQSLLIEDDRLGLAPGAQVDAEQFRAGLAAPQPDAAALGAALALYRGDFLDGFTLPDAPAFDDWAVREREAWRALAIRGWAALGRLHEAQGSPAAALAALDRALALDPLQEELQRDCLRLQYLAGDRAGAIRRYETLTRLLEDELGVPPMPETRAVYTALINDRLPASSTAPVTPAPAFTPPAVSAAAPLLQFTGRSAELETLTGLCGSGRLVLVEGAPGIGKTRLVEEFLRGLRASAPPLVLHGTAHELEQGLPYQPVVDALRRLLAAPEWPALRAQLDLAPLWLSELTRLLPELRAQAPDLPPAGETADESRLWEAICRLLQDLARRRRLVLFLDDLHWADSSTLGLLGYLARRAASPSILILVTARPLEPRSRLGLLVRELSHEGRLARLALAPLSMEATDALARQLSPASPTLLARWLADNAEGNPYFLTELVRHAYTTNVLGRDGALDPGVLAASQVLPPTVQNLILSRLMRLSEDARRALDVAAVIGREFDFDLVHRTLAAAGPPRSESATLDALDELQAAVLIQPRRDARFSFDHSLTMEVALQDMGETRAGVLHRQLAQTLEQMAPAQAQPEAVAGLIARHYAQGRAPERAGPYAWRAGRYAAGLAAWEEAIAFYAQALQTESQPGRRAEILIAMGTARFHKGDFAQSSDALYAALELARGLPDLDRLEEAYMALNLSLMPQSRYAEAAALGRDLAASGPPELAVCAHFTWGAALAVGSAAPLEAEAHLRQAERLLAAQPDYHGRVNLAHIHYQLASAVGQQGRSAQAVELYLQALERVRQDASSLDLLRQIMLYNNLAYHLHLLGDAEAAAGYARAGIQLARERGSLTHMSYLLSTSGEIALQQGNLDEAEGYFAEGLRLAQQIPLQERVAGLTANLALVDVRRGLPEQARQRLEQALALADQLGVGHLAVRIRCWLAPLLPPPEARLRLEEARRLASQSGFTNLLEDISRLEQEIK